MDKRFEEWGAGVVLKTVHDRVAPSNYYTVLEVAKYEGIPEPRAEGLYKATVDLVTAQCAKEKIPLNRAHERWNDIGVSESGEPLGWKFDKTMNALHWHTKLAPIAGLFRIFMVKRLNYTSAGAGALVWVCDFGILKTHYDTYRKTGKVYKPACRKLPKYGDAPTSRHRAKIDVPNAAQYQRLKAGAKRAGASVAETAMLALTEYMDARPETFGAVDGFLPQQKRTVEKRANKLQVELSAEICERLDGFVQRWNAGCNAPISRALVVENALFAYLNAMPHQYSDPELWEQEKKRDGKG